jgi:AraC-like DNA-binding protein
VAYYFSIEDIFHRPNLPVDIFRVVHDEPMPLHQHEFAELVIVARGEAVHTIDASEQLIMMGDVFLVHPSSAHSYDSVKELELINILFHHDLLEMPRRYSASLGSDQPGWLLPPQRDLQTGRPTSHMKLDTDRLVSLQEMVRELEEVAFADPDYGTMCIVTSLLLKIIGTLQRWQMAGESQERNTEYQVAKAFSYIADNFTDHVTLADLTRRSGMSESSLTRAFRRSSGLTPIEYVISYRIKQGCRLLQYTDKNVTEIAFECGFSDSNYFSRKFHDLTELTPLQFRKQSRSRKPPFDAVLPQPSQSGLQSSRR